MRNIFINKHGQHLDMDKLKIDHNFALLPAFIRQTGEWVWLKKYTRFGLWCPELNRYRTVHTALGHVLPESLAREVEKWANQSPTQKH